jgi:hypothetical protein
MAAVAVLLLAVDFLLAAILLDAESSDESRRKLERVARWTTMSGIKPAHESCGHFGGC